MNRMGFFFAAGWMLAGMTLFGAGARQGRVALHTWLTTAEFKEISVTGLDGKTLWEGVPDPAKCAVGKDGRWSV